MASDLPIQGQGGFGPVVVHSGNATQLPLASGVQITTPSSVSPGWNSVEAPDVFAATGSPNLAGPWASTEGSDAFAASGTVPDSGTWASTEAKDVFAAAGGQPITITWASTEAKDAFVGSAWSPPLGTFNATEAQDSWQSHPGFPDILGIEGAVQGGGSVAHFSTNGPNRVIVFVSAGIAADNGPNPITAVSCTGDGAGITWVPQDIIVSPEYTNGVSRIEIWYGFSPKQLTNETINVTYGDGGGGGGGFLTNFYSMAFAVKGLNGNYANPFCDTNPLSRGANSGAFFPPPNTQTRSISPVATGPAPQGGTSGGTTTVFPTFTAGDESNVVVHSGGEIISSTGSGGPNNWAGATATLPAQKGNVYYEVVFNHIAGSKYGTGLFYTTGASGGVSGLVADGSGGIVLRGDGTIWHNGSQVGSLGVTPANGDVIGCAYNLDKGLAWFIDVTQSSGYNGHSTLALQTLIPYSGTNGYIAYGLHTGGGTTGYASGITPEQWIAMGGAVPLSGYGAAAPYALTDGTSSSAEQTYVFDPAHWVGTPPDGFGPWGSVVSVSGTPPTHSQWAGVIIGAAFASQQTTSVTNSAPPGYIEIANYKHGGAQRDTELVVYGKVLPAQNQFASDNDYQPGATTNGWVMMYDTLVGIPSPGYWYSSEAPDRMVANGWAVSSGITGIFSTSEAKDTFAATGLSVSQGAWFSTEAKDIFSCFIKQPVVGTWASTEAKDRFVGAGIGLGENGIWVSTEAVDIFAASVTVPTSGPWLSTENPDQFLALGNGVVQVRRRRIFFVT